MNLRQALSHTFEQDIRVLFSEFGSVKECSLVLDQETGESKGFAFVDMPEHEEAKTALNKLNMSKLGNNTIRVKVANS